MKKKIWKGMVALGLAGIILLQSTPSVLLEAAAEEIKEIFAAQEQVKENVKVENAGALTDRENLWHGEIVGEDKSRRTATTKTYHMSDDTIMVRQYSESIHYYENGKYKEKSNKEQDETQIENAETTTFNSINVFEGGDTVKDSGFAYAGRKDGMEQSDVFLHFAKPDMGPQYVLVGAKVKFTYETEGAWLFAGKDYGYNVYVADSKNGLEEIDYNNKPKKLQELEGIEEKTQLIGTTKSYESNEIDVANIDATGFTIGIESQAETTASAYISIPLTTSVTELNSTPTVEYIYVNIGGLEDEYSMETFTVEGATAYVNHATGNLTVDCELASINTMMNLPFSANLIYNSEYNSTLSSWGKGITYGNHFKLNFQQYVREIEDESVYEYMDADGTITTFYKMSSDSSNETDNNKYVALSKNLILEVESKDNVRIYDAQNNQMLFTSGVLTEISVGTSTTSSTRSMPEWISISYNTAKTQITKVSYMRDTTELYSFHFNYSTQGLIGLITKYKSTQLNSYSLTYDTYNNLKKVKNNNENVNVLTLSYMSFANSGDAIDTHKLQGIVDYSRSGLYFERNMYNEPIQKVHNVIASDIYDTENARFYDYTEFTYNENEGTRVEYYDENVKMTGIPTEQRYVAFNNLHRRISEWKIDALNVLHVWNNGVWQDNKDYEEESKKETFSYSYKRQYDVDELVAALSQGESEEITIDYYPMGKSYDDTYYRYALNFKIENYLGIDAEITGTGIETKTVELTRGSELYVSILIDPTETTSFTVSSNASGTTAIKNVSCTLVDYTYVQEKLLPANTDETTATTTEKERRVSQATAFTTKGERVITTYDHNQRTKSMIAYSSENTSYAEHTAYTYYESGLFKNQVKTTTTKEYLPSETTGETLSFTEYTYTNSEQVGTKQDVISKTVVTEQGDYATYSNTEQYFDTDLNAYVLKDVTDGYTTKATYALHAGDVRLTKVEYGTTRETYVYNYLGQVTEVKVYSTSGSTASLIYEQTNTYASGMYMGSTYGDNTYGFTYDESGLVTSITETATGESEPTPMLTYTYNAANVANSNALTRKTYVNGQIEDYDQTTSFMSVSHKRSATATVNETYSYLFNREGDLRSQTYRDAVDNYLVYNYGDLADQEKQTLTISGNIPYQGEYTVYYDKLKERATGFWLNLADGCAITNFRGTYTYGDEGELTSSSFGRINTEYTYDDLDRITSITRRNNGYPIKTDYEYRTYQIGNAVYETNDVIRISSDKAPTDCTTTYDENGYITSIRYPNMQSTYEYDRMGRLSKQTNNGSTVTYSYANDNCFVSKTESGVQTTYMYDENGRLIQAGNWSFMYDAMGNPTTYKGNTFVWTQGRKLASGSMNGNEFTYTYDGNGMRYKKTVGNGETVYYLDGTRVMAEYRRGYSSYNGMITYAYDATGVVGMIYNDTYYAYEKNTLGDIIAIYDDNGSIVAEYTYDAWGKTISMTGRLANINPFRYRGYYYDTETGFYYLQTRYYDPTIMRFINADNYELVAELSQTIGQLNLYAYANNNPIMLTDETGEGILTFLIVVGISALLGAIDGGVTAVAAEQDFWKGAAAGAIGGAVGGMIGFLSGGTPLGSLVARGVSSSIYNLGNELFQTGTITTNNLGVYAVDVLMDVTYSMLYAGYFSGFSNQFLSTFLVGTTDGVIDIIQTLLFFSPTAQRRICQGN